MAPKKRSKYTSRGQRRPVRSGLLSLVRKSRSAADRLLAKHDAWLAGKNPWLTYPNPNRDQTNRPFIRFRANMVWGDPKRQFNRDTKHKAESND